MQSLVFSRLLCWQKRHVCAFSLSHTHSPSNFAKRRHAFGIPRQEIKKNINKNKRIHRSKKKPTPIATGRWLPSGVRREGVRTAPLTMVSWTVISMRNEQFMCSPPYPPPSPLLVLHICTVIAKRPLSLSFSFICAQLAKSDHIEIRFGFIPNRTAHSYMCSMIYQHFWGICDGFLWNYLTIIRLLKISYICRHTHIHIFNNFLCLLWVCFIYFLFVYTVRVFSQNIRVSCETVVWDLTTWCFQVCQLYYRYFFQDQQLNYFDFTFVFFHISNDFRVKKQF